MTCGQETNINHDQAFKVFVWFGKQSSIWSKDPSVSIVPIWSLWLDVFWCILDHTLLR